MAWFSYKREKPATLRDDRVFIWCSVQRVDYAGLDRAGLSIGLTTLDNYRGISGALILFLL